jgi:hypothetical protein
MQPGDIANLVNAVLAGLAPAPGGVVVGGDMRDLKVPMYDRSDRSAEAWLAFKGNWLSIRQLKGWNWAISRHRLKASMKGDAYLSVSEISVDAELDDEQKRNDEADARNPPIPVAARDVQYPLDEYRFNRVMRAYEGVFLLESGTSYARTAFQLAAQTETESIQDWHARLKILYRRAYPEANLETTPELIHRFVQYIRHPQVVAQTKRANPPTLTAALQAATAEWSVLLDMQALGQVRPGFSKTGAGGIHMIGALESASTGGDRRRQGSCYYCGIAGHYKRDCRKFAADEGRSPPASSGSAGETSSPGPRGGPKKFGQGQRRGVHAMEDAGEEDFYPQVYAVSKARKSGN